MKKLLVITLALALLLPAPVLAEEVASLAGMTTANAVVECVNTYDLTAPFAGVVQPFSWEAGDKVSADDALFTLDTVKVYAPATGVVKGVFVEESDLCQDAIAQYGMIASVEKTIPLVVDGDTKGAYNDDDNKILHLGDTVYFEQTNDTDNEGEGRITALNGDAFTVEITAGDFMPKDNVKLYRDEKMGTKTCVGTGVIRRAKDVAVQGAGRVLQSYFRQGQAVKKGQLMFELIPEGSDGDVKSAQVPAGHDGVLGAPQAISGQQVYKGQVLVTVHDTSALRVVAEVDEMDLDLLKIGDSLPVVFDRYPNAQVSGTVQSISQMGKEKQNATYYDVKITFSTSAEVLPGMNATVYLPSAR